MTPLLPAATDFTDMPVKPLPRERFAGMSGFTVLCPKCQGRGGWNLALNEYGPGKHFRGSCMQCNGWGWVRPGPDADCIHDYEEIRSQHMHEHIYRCRKCQTTISTDSSG